MPEVHNLRHPCIKCSFYKESIWQPVVSDSVSTLERGYSSKNLDVGQILFEQGAKNRGVFCVSSGLIAVRSYHVNGASTLLRLVYPGEVIGFRSFLGNGCHQTEARALLPSRICTVAKRDATQVIDSNPLVLARLALRCISEIDRSHERIIATATASNKKRLANILMQLMEHHGKRVGDQIRMQLPMSRTDLADLIGVQPETMSRLVKRLERDGEFVISGREVQIFVAKSPPKSVDVQSKNVA